MRPNKLRELLKSNKPTLSTHIHTTWPSVVEAIGHTGLYDYVEFVGEYGPFDLHDLDNLARAADIYNMSMQLKVDQEPRGFLARSEEHTSELQSQSNLVCRLLLEKKKT